MSVLTFYTNPPPASTRYAMNLLNAESARRRFALARQGMRGERLRAKTDYPLPQAETALMWQTAPSHPTLVWDAPSSREGACEELGAV